jgi:hypothetical protein
LYSKATLSQPFWIEDGVFNEGYKTKRGKWGCVKIEVPNMPDKDVSKLKDSVLDNAEIHALLF